MFQHLVVGLLASGLIASAGYKLRALSKTGVIAAIMIGTTLFVFTSVAWYGTLIVFFLTSTGWSKWRKRQKRKAESTYEKGGRRDAWQVLANGGAATLCGVVYYVWPSVGWWFVFVGVMASVNADTWATEIGGLSKRLPRSIVTLRQVPRGTSGGVSMLGSVAAACGALTIGVSAALLLNNMSGSWIVTEGEGSLAGGWLLIIAALIGGLAGAFFDSLVGSTVQRMNRCTVCGAEIEQHTHCSQSSERLRGWRWMNNDAVNALSSVFGGVVSWLCWILLL